MDTLASLSRDLVITLEEGPGTAARLRADSALLEHLTAIAVNTRSVSSALQAEDALPARLAADSLGTVLSAMADALRSLRGEERASEVTEAVVSLAERLERISVSLDKLDRDLRAGRGTAGRALYDNEIARQQETFQAKLDSLRSELRQKPWRWLRFKLF